MVVEAVQGTRDFYPAEMERLQGIFEVWVTVCESFGYEAFDGPLLEPASLYAKSGGDIPEQVYSFVDKGGRELVVRPELTPTLARMVVARQRELQKPIKWYSFPRCWRYERPQKGRTREFFQLNVDCLGTSSMRADAEVIVTAIRIMEMFGLSKKDFYVRISNRKLVQSLFSSFVSLEKMEALFRVIDKRDKMSKKDFQEAVVDLGVSVAKVEEILGVSSLAALKRFSLDDAGKKGLWELEELFSYLKLYGVSPYLVLDLSIARGLLYYTSTVFEVFDRGMVFRAIAGGGRYDDLVKDFGGEPCPGVGYGMGNEVLTLFLASKGLLEPYKKEIDCYIVALGDTYAEVVKLAEELREEGNVVEVDVSGLDASKQMKLAKRNARFTIVVGEDELKRGVYTVKSAEGEKVVLKREDLSALLDSVF